MSNAIYPATIRGLTFTVMKSLMFNTLGANKGSPNFFETRLRQSVMPVWTYELTYEYLKDNPSDLALGLTQTDLRTLMGFFAARTGMYDEFLFEDPDDSFVGPGVFTFAANFWMARYPFPLGTIIIDGGSGHAQQVITAGYAGMARSGATVPSWNHAGGTTVDGDLVWKDLGVSPTGSVGGIANGWPNPDAKLQLVNDGFGNYYSPIQRLLGGQFYEDVTDINPITLIPPNDPTVLGLWIDGITQQPNNVNQIYSFVGPGWGVPGYSFLGWGVKWNANVTNTGWQLLHGYALNATLLDPAGHIQKVTTSGTSGISMPVWNDTGGTTTDGSVVWTDQGYNPGPSPTIGITAQFKWYHRVRFDMDEQAFDKFMSQLWTAGGGGAKNSGSLRLRTSRLAAQ